MYRIFFANGSTQEEIEINPIMAGTQHPKRHNRRPPADPRAHALTVLNRLEISTLTLDAVLDQGTHDDLSQRNRALFNSLVYGVLRWRQRLDAVIAAYASRPLKKMSPTVRNILRLALFQIQFMDRIPESAAVNTAVNLARAHRNAPASGFINALLRNVIRDPGRYRPPHANDDPVEFISVTHSLPRWLAARWIDRLGMEETQQLCAAVNTVPPIGLRCNTLATTLTDLAAALSDHARSVEPMAGISGGLNLLGPRRPIHEMPAFNEGLFSVQDGAAQLVSMMADPRPGETVLDACAGLGGKTTHLAQLMENRGRVIALDQLTSKLTQLNREADRLGLTNIETHCLDLNQPPDPESLPGFDRILVDAPCSGLGVLRRNPDAKWSARKQDINRFADRQVRFLDHIAPLLKPGGTLVFAVCSMEPEENFQVVERFLKKRKDFVITGPQPTDAPSVTPFLDAQGCLYTAPHVHHLDGFFAARLVRVR